MGIVNARYGRNRTAKGNPTATPAKKALYYYGYGVRQDNPEQLARGHWYGPDGDTTYGETVNWATNQAKRHKLHYKIMISVRDGRMQSEDFAKAMAASGLMPNDYRLILHTDTDHDHAHILVFRDKPLHAALFQKWRAEVLEEINKLEQERIIEREREQALSLGQDPIENELEPLFPDDENELDVDDWLDW